jgi:cytochrome b involved in lipid metabolism
MFRLCSNAKRTRNVSSIIQSYSLCWGVSQVSTLKMRGVQVQGHLGTAAAAIVTCGFQGVIPYTTGTAKRQSHPYTTSVIFPPLSSSTAAISASASAAASATSSRASKMSSFGSISQSSAAIMMSLAMAVSSGYYFLVQQQNVYARLEEETTSATETPTLEEEAAAGEDSLLPVYTSKDVARHNSTEDGSKRIWMSYGGYVYDVTDFIPNHPGGTEKILLAAGSHIEPYWDTYRQHFSSLLPLQYLEAMKIGILDEQDQQRIDDQMEKETISPYAYEPVRNPELIIHTEQPANMETPYTKLTDNYITPSEVMQLYYYC